MYAELSSSIFEHKSRKDDVTRDADFAEGAIQQYAGRLHREDAGKKDVRIYDYIEQNHVQLARIWNKRERGYRAMGYLVRQKD